MTLTINIMIANKQSKGTWHIKYPKRRLQLGIRISLLSLLFLRVKI